MRKSQIIQAVDMYCGAGGTSTGMIQACKELGLTPNLLAINHWQMAIDTHTSNHPGMNHLCQNVDNVDPRSVVPSGKLHLLVASPECTHFSNARGGRPVTDQTRAAAWNVVRWAEALRIENILIENVKEFMHWGPLGASGHPMKSMRGRTFLAFVDALRSLNYNVDWRVLNAANYGDATTRERLFIIARRGKKTIQWPEPSHSKAGIEAFHTSEKWKPVREVIDWSIPGQSIFSRKRPLRPATLARIEAGLKRFGGKYAEPFLVILRNHADAQTLDKPLPTITASGQHFGLVEPFIASVAHGKGDKRAYSIDEPLRTATQKGTFALVEPFIIPQFTPSRPRSVEEPINTITTTSRGIALVQPMILSIDHNGTVAVPKSIDEPLGVVTTKARFAVVEPLIVRACHGPHDKGVWSVNEPIRTLTTKDQFGLVEMDDVRLDIRFRMLQPHELSAAMSFPDGYKFAGNREEQVRQIGNAVPVKLAEALCRYLLSEYAEGKAA